MQINEVRTLINTEMQQVATLIADQFGSDVEMIKEVSSHITGGGGKRLRPMLALLSGKAFGYTFAQTGQSHIIVAAIVELIHTATLLHDDVVDHSSLRRGKKTANTLWGNEASILVGDFLYSRSFQMMVEIDSMHVMRILANASNVIAEGEVMQLVNCHDSRTDEAKYMETILRKTATLFEAAAELGAVVSKQDAATCAAMAKFGLHLGMAFQLVDDALDYGASNKDIGKNLGDDLAEGKPTLPLIHILKNGNPEQIKLVRDAIENSSTDNLNEIKTAIADTRALDYTLEVAKKQVDTAVSNLESIPDSEYKDALIALARYSIAREF